MHSKSSNPLQPLSHGIPHTAHRDYLTASQSSSSAAIFRSDASSSSQTAAEDFGLFAAAHQHPDPLPYDPPYTLAVGPSRLNLPTGQGSSPPIWTRNAAHDGAELLALLESGSCSLLEGTEGDWEAELHATQARRMEEGRENLPADPWATHRARAARDEAQGIEKGKGRADLSHDNTGEGNLSPTSEELLSSLSSLDLSSRAYLRTLLSLPPEIASEDYLTNGSYTDDVHGLPEDVRRMFEKASAQGEGGRDAEDGRAKAVRRLGMMMRQLQASEAGGPSGESRTASGEETAGKQHASGRVAGKTDTPEAVRPLNQHEAITKAFSSQLQSRPAATQQTRAAETSKAKSVRASEVATITHTSQAHSQSTSSTSASFDSLSCSQPLVFPSSLSSSAFITMQPRLHAPPAAPLAPQPARLAASPPLAPPTTVPDTRLPPFADYFVSYQRMTLSNGGGSTGPDWTKRLMTNWSGERQGIRVEGRTH
ncbi:hypothetical protein JCM11641_000997 [Rhodosporidiobolus odoratus]